MKEAVVMIVSLPKECIMQGRAVLVGQPPDRELLVWDYDVPNFSDTAIKIILTYTDYVSKTVCGGVVRNFRPTQSLIKAYS